MQAETNIFPLTWDLDCFFKKKGKEKDLQQFINSTKSQLEELSTLLKTPSKVSEAFKLSQDISMHLAEIEAFIHCLFAEDITYTYSLQLQGELRLLQAHFENLSSLLDETLRTLDEPAFDMLLKDPFLKSLEFPLKERKLLAREKLPYAFEALITNLSIDGYHGYSQLFSTVHSHLKFPLQNTCLSIGQIDNEISSSDREKRQLAFQVYHTVFKDHEAHFAEILNHLAGFRIQIYKQRGWTPILKEPLTANRMNEATLTSLWDSVRNHNAPFAKFLKTKALLLGLDALSWHDVDAPLAKSSSNISYQEACEVIVEQFGLYSPKMAAFSKKALTSRWIEVENRSHKAAGGFCIGFPLKKESRIFMTYCGTQDNISTLAHELGHAYHNEVIFSHPYFNQNIKMNVAETASTMAEMMVADALLEKASSKEEKIAILDDKISRSIAFCMNIQARFIFEKTFYEERSRGYVLPERLCQLMEEAQKIAFCDSLSEWHPYFWASKMHFYFTDVPFYNFPYTFGYLFSLGIYTHLKQDKKSFEKKYDALLYDTPLMSTEALAKKHLGVDLTQTTFWDMAMQEASKDVEAFFNLLETPCS
jgi:pepF/M3 family oligoendopeptidase